MRVKRLIEILLVVCDGDINKEVKFDATIPKPLEEVFSIEGGKSWVLFKKIKE